VLEDLCLQGNPQALACSPRLGNRQRVSACAYVAVVQVPYLCSGAFSETFTTPRVSSIQGEARNPHESIPCGCMSSK
jgi:hypothetical protein